MLIGNSYSILGNRLAAKFEQVPSTALLFTHWVHSPPKDRFSSYRTIFPFDIWLTLFCFKTFSFKFNAAVKISLLRRKVISFAISAAKQYVGNRTWRNKLYSEISFNAISCFENFFCVKKRCCSANYWQIFSAMKPIMTASSHDRKRRGFQNWKFCAYCITPKDENILGR